MNSLRCHLNQQRSKDMHLELSERNVFFSFLSSIFYRWINKFCIEIVTEEVFWKRLFHFWPTSYYCCVLCMNYLCMSADVLKCKCFFLFLWFLFNLICISLNVIIWESIWNLGHGIGMWLWKKWCSMAIIFSIISWRNVSEIY